MIHDHSPFRGPSTTPPTMNWVMKFLDQPVIVTTSWTELHREALRLGYAVNAMGCLFTLMPGVTIQHPRSY